MDQYTEFKTGNIPLKSIILCRFKIRAKGYKRQEGRGEGGFAGLMKDRDNSVENTVII